MPYIFLNDTVTGKRYNLTKLLKENRGEITVGRSGNGNVIELGENIPFAEEETKTHNTAMFDISTVSKHHATIRRIGDFYIKDCSTNGTRINGEHFSLEWRVLLPERELFFGSYGPVICELGEE